MASQNERKKHSAGILGKKSSVNDDFFKKKQPFANKKRKSFGLNF